MADLIEKFFQEDLTGAEEKALGEELLSSEETALRLGEKAEAAYKSLGLPEPIWPGSGPSIPYATKPFSRFWMWFCVLLAGMIGVSAWWCFSHKSPKPVSLASSNTISSKPSSTTVLPHLIKPKQPRVESRQDLNRPLTMAAVPATTGKKPVLGTKELPVVELPPVVSTPLNAFPPPLNLDQNPNQAYSSLSVVIRRSTPGFLTVRVLNAQGEEVVLIYRGDLAAGNWVFEWNGRLVDGRTAPPGDYQIQVQSDSFDQKKPIQIR